MDLATGIWHLWRTARTPQKELSGLEPLDSQTAQPGDLRPRPRRRPRSPFFETQADIREKLLLLACSLLLCVQPFAALATDPVAAAQEAFTDTQKLYLAKPSDGQAAWQFARAAFDLAEFATNSSQRAELADKGIAACRQLVSREPDSAAGHYYLGMNLGQLARTKGIGALKLVKEMEREFKRAGELDDRFDHAGPERNLGLLYRDAPALGSIGSRVRARQHLQRAVELAPDYPENHLNLLESCLKWNDRNGARRELKAWQEMLPAAHSHFSGDAWKASWTDWETRYETAKRSLEEPSKAIESPRTKE